MLENWDFILEKRNLENGLVSYTTHKSFIDKLYAKTIMLLGDHIEDILKTWM